MTPGVDTAAPEIRCTPEVERLEAFLRRHRRVVVLTGAGCSTESGIPDYRDASGGWKRTPPIQWRQFMGDHRTRQRYWARSQVGWQRIHTARPNAAHRALAALEAGGPVAGVITQNVDGLHQRAGSRRVIDLHGRLDRVECLDCGGVMRRDAYQGLLQRFNSDWGELDAGNAPDGDADLDGLPFHRFQVPDCPGCGGLIRPSVVFFGEGVPRPRVDAAMARLRAADALLVVGSSLMVWSGYRFVREARRLGLPAAALNLGRTRADSDLEFRIEAACGAVLEVLAGRLA
jgi:NAD-dependent SIR2 family protein deacetylase